MILILCLYEEDGPILLVRSLQYAERLLPYDFDVVLGLSVAACRKL